MIKKLKKAIEWYGDRLANSIYLPTGMIPYNIVKNELNKNEK